MGGLFADVDSVTAGLNISYVYVDELEAPAAAVDYDGVKLILINRSFLAKIPDNVLRTVAEKGLRLHEGWEHRYHNIPLRNQILEKRKVQHLNCSVWASIENIVGDAHIEAKGAKDYPNLSKYRSFVLSRMYRMRVQDEELDAAGSELDKAVAKIIQKVRKQRGIEVNPALIKTMEAFIEAAKFGGVQKRYLDENVLADLRFIIPRVFLTRRGIDCQVVFQAADEIYHYLDKRYRIPPELSIQIVVSTPSVSQEKSGERDFEQILPWRSTEEVDKDVENAIAEVKNQLEEAERRGDDESAVGGLLGAPDHAKLTPPTTRDIEFYVDTVQKRGETIRRLQSLFKRLAGKRWFVPAREGDLNTKPSVLQQAYADSFKPGEDERNYYLIMRHAIPDIDLVIASDTSGCCSPSTQVQLANGDIVSIESLFSQPHGLQVAAINLSSGEVRAQPILHTFKYASPPKLYEVKTPLTNGYFTGNHRFFTLNPSKLALEERFAQQLRPGDRILVSTSVHIQGTTQRLSPPRAFKRTRGNHRNWRMPRIPRVLTPKFAQLLGYMTGDGDFREGSIGITDKNWPTLTFYQKIVADVLGLPSTITLLGGRQRLQINSTVLASYMKTYFPEIVARSRMRAIPPAVLRSPLRVVAAFLRGAFDAEGSVGHHQIRFLTTSKIWATQVRMALARFGIAASWREIIVPKRTIGKHKIKETPIVYTDLTDRPSIRRFAEKIGFTHPSKRRALKRVLQVLNKSRPVSRLETLPLSEAVREVARLAEFNIKERRRFRLLDYLYRSTGRRRAKRYLQLLDTKLEEIRRLQYMTDDLPELVDACRLMKIPFSQLSKLTGRSKRQITNTVYGLRQGINKGQIAARRANEIANRIRPLVRTRRLHVLIALQSQRDALYKILQLLEAGTVKLVRVKKVTQREAETEFVYDLEVQSDHNYIANGAITHNSMYSSAEVVSEASICIIEAAKRVGKIRTAVVSFGDGIRILKDFHEPVAGGRFYPAAAGGTPMAEALQQALKFRWRWSSRVRRVMVICTDGFPDDFNKVDKPLKEMRKRKIVPIALCIGVEPNDEYRSRFDQVYEVKQTDAQLFSAFLDSFIRNALLVHR